MQKKYRKLLIGTLAFVIAGSFCCLRQWDGEESVWENLQETEPYIQMETAAESQPQTEREESLWVHICGAVEKPGVYELPVGSRIYELLALAGGAAPDGMADALNLADVLSDGERIVVPTKEEASTFIKKEASSGGLINLNTATRQELMGLPGIGEAKADDIIRYREENGGFREITDIMKISGIKEALFQKIKDLITV